jgi:nucleoside-diphosphate-sugar epimerase
MITFEAKIQHAGRRWARHRRLVDRMGTQLVLGANGSLGRWTVSRLVARGESVRALVRDPARAPSGEKEERVRVLQGDALRPEDVRDAASGAASIFHCVNVPYPEWEAKALPMLDNTIRAARAARAKIVFPGNVYVFGHAQSEFVAEDHPRNPHTKKGRIRVEMERRLDALWRAERVPYTIVRFPDFYGPDVVNALYRPVFLNALRAKPMSWYGKLDIPFEFSYIEDAAEALVLAGLDPTTAGETYHVPGCEVTTPRAWLGQVAKSAGSPSRIRAVPKALVALTGLFNAEARAFYEMQYLRRERLVLDGSKFHAKFGQVAATPYEEGIRRTLEWYRSYHPHS